MRRRVLGKRFGRKARIQVCLNPASGKDMQGHIRTCIVLSPKAFNVLGVSIIAPITQGGNFARFKGFSVPLMGLETQGVVLVNGIRSLDPIARRAVYIEKADDVVIDDCLAKLEAILGYE